MQHNSNYDLLINKLDEFIRRFYLNQLLRGLIYAATLLLALFLLANSLEYFFFLSPIGRKILFYGFIATTVFVGYRWIFQPLFSYYRLGKVISHEKAAQIIGQHFGAVEDRLLNVLQLKKQSEGLTDASLITASINQKIEQLKPVPFSAAIDLKHNRKYLRFLAIPLLALVVILFTAPSIISEGSLRLLHNGTAYERPAPFKFKVLNKDLQAVQYSDFDLNVEVDGNSLPDQVYVKQGGNNFKMQKKSATSYVYKFSNLQKDADFVLTAVGFDSKEYTLKVLPKPMIVGFQVSLDYPDYTGKKDETLQNVGDLNVPAGTHIIWDFNANNTNDIRVKLDDTTYTTTRGGQNKFVFTRSFKQTSPYTLKVSGDELKNADSITYTVSVVPDQFPTIDVKSVEDSVAHSYLYFMGNAGDDYGVRNVNLAYKVAEDGSDGGTYKTIPITFPRGSKNGEFSYYWQTGAMDLKPGENVTYYFEAWDNDAVNGSKSTRTLMMSFKVPSKAQLDSLVHQGNEQIKQSLASTMDKADQLQKQADELRDKMTEKKSLNWEDKKQLEELVQKEKDLQNNIQDFQKQLDENMERQQQNNEPISESLKQKQEQLKNLFDQVLNEETKKLFNKLDSLLSQMDKKDIMDQLEDFKMNNEQLEKDMDRMLSLFKQVQFEQKLDETVNDVKKLAEQQDSLNKQTDNKEGTNEELAKKQDDLNQKMDDVKKNMDQLKDINKDMEQPVSLEKAEQDMKQAEQNMQDSKQSLSNGKNKKASESQKSASQKMKDMADNLEQMQSGQQAEEMELDMKAIRQLLKNLVSLSFDQEDVMKRVGTVNLNSPEYLALMKDQNKIKDNSEMVEDSLYALAKRVIQIESFVTTQMRDVNRSIKKSVSTLEDRNRPAATTAQQYAMTGFNNLALMLSEVMDQMQQQMQQQKPGMGQCKKPGNNKKPGMGMSEMQKQLNDEIQKLQQQQQSGPKNDKGQKPGEKQGGTEGGQMSKELAQAAAKQKAIRQALQKMAEEQMKDGKGGMGDVSKLLDEMNKTETELVNKQLTNEMLKRQKEIQTRLLEAETAMKERETDKERKSETAKEVSRKIPPSLEEYLKKREAELQLYKTVPPALKPYYKNLVETYFKNISF